MTMQKRTENWWEPVFSKQPLQLGNGDWDALSRESEGLTFKRWAGTSSPKRIARVTFTDCDFEDDFTATRFIFHDCKFIRCDFGGSVWKYSKFRDCEFQRTSFSISTFNDCEFRDCRFEKIAFSGNTTIIPSTLITNPYEFISAADIFKSQIPPHVSARFQKAHLLITQSTLSRVIMDTLSREGSEETYYDAVKCRTIMAARARFAPKLIKVYGKRRKIPFRNLMLGDIVGFMGISFLRVGALIEEVILRTLGAMNAWGASVSRSVLVGMLIVALFTWLHHLADSSNLKETILKTCEVFFLFGYTNYTFNLDMPFAARALYLANAVAGLIWYAVFITTVINKLTRQRG